ncbi:hypothetical protein FXF62_01625 [Streptococcus cristatus]|uniref:Uncharacterized protein n=1 Tax=Streptococcus cristatus TaxID=45634 RepID=A0A5B0DQ55_STRCR|nr:hypothetical protein FXF62_01625 [Streptococcus cristatus]
MKSFNLCYSECAWDGLSKWFIEQFYFSSAMATIQKSNGFAVAFLYQRDYCSRLANMLYTIKEKLF